MAASEEERGMGLWANIPETAYPQTINPYAVVMMGSSVLPQGFAAPVVIPKNLPKPSVPGTAATLKERRRRARVEAVIAEFDPK